MLLWSSKDGVAGHLELLAVYPALVRLDSFSLSRYVGLYWPRKVLQAWVPNF